MRRAASNADSLSKLARIGTREAAGKRSERCQVNIACHGLAFAVHLENLLTALEVGAIDDDLAVEATGPEQGRVEDGRRGWSPRS